MKTLENHVLLYDQDCPLCRAYSNVFVQTGMLANDGRQNWATRSEDIDKQIDKERSRNEIALVNIQTGKVYYGTESLVKIIGNSFWLVRAIWKLTIIKLIFNILYHFISFNRHIIIPRKVGNYTCSPDFNIKSRIAFILITSLVSSVILSNYFANFSNYPFKNHTIIVEFGVFMAHFLIQSIIIRKQAKAVIADYLGNNSFVSFLGSMVLVIITLLCENEMLKLVLFTLVAVAMLIEHHRRVILLNLPSSLTLSWLLFRVLLGIIVITLVLF